MACSAGAIASRMRAAVVNSIRPASAPTALSATPPRIRGTSTQLNSGIATKLSASPAQDSVPKAAAVTGSSATATTHCERHSSRRRPARPRSGELAAAPSISATTAT
jgi:hypothetical protein